MQNRQTTKCRVIQVSHCKDHNQWLTVIHLKSNHAGMQQYAEKSFENFDFEIIWGEVCQKWGVWESFDWHFWHVREHFVIPFMAWWRYTTWLVLHVLVWHVFELGFDGLYARIEEWNVVDLLPICTGFKDLSVEITTSELPFLTRTTCLIEQ